MGPLGAIDSVFTQFFSLRGRACRSEYWWFLLMHTIITFAAVFADVWIFISNPQPVPSLNPFSYFTTFWLIITIIPMFTLTIRRLHDSGKSGWWYLTFSLPVVGWIFWLVTMCQDSERGANSYGPPPFGPRGSTYDGVDPANPNVTHRRQQTHNPYAGYALVAKADAPVTPEMQAARKEQMAEYYRTRVLGQPGSQEA